MNKGVDWYQYIEPYNLGKLPTELNAQFEAALQTDEALAAAVATQRTEWEMQELMAENLLRAQIREEFATRGAKPVDGLNWWPRNWKYVLTAMIVLIVAVYCVFRALEKTPTVPVLPENPSGESTPPIQAPNLGRAQAPPPEIPSEDAAKTRGLRQLAMARYQVPESLSGVRGQTDEDTLALATKAFFEKKYRVVLQLLTTLPENETQEALSLRAHAHFNAGNYSAASRDFSTLESGGIYRREAEWFGLLARMAMPDSDKKAIDAELNKIRKQPNHRFARDAEKLWKALK